MNSESDKRGIVKVKTNQPKLYEQIETASKQQTVEHQEKTRDRNSYRKVEVFEPPENFDPLWIGIGSVIKLNAVALALRNLINASVIIFVLYHLNHAVENSLHWVKDVIYEEDISPQKVGFAPRNLSLLKTWVLTFLRVHGFESIKSAISEMSHNLGYILTFCS